MNIAPTLSDMHKEMLRRSAISEEVIVARGYKTLVDAKELGGLGFSSSQQRVPGLLLPLWTTDGEVLSVYRPDNPRVVEDKSKRNPDGTYPNKIIKYEFPKGVHMRLDCPPMAHAQIGNPSIPLWITEGQKKADSLVSAGLCAVALLGVWNWRGTNDVGGKVLLPDWNLIALNGREIHIVFDSDVMQKPEVQKALRNLIAMLSNKHASVNAVYLPPVPGRGKVGVDDWLYAGHTLEDLDALVEAPRLAPVPAAAIIELLDEMPPTISRPLSLINGTAYAASWLPVRITMKETSDKNGNITRHDPPLVTSEKRLFIVREDGAVFGEGANSMELLGLDIHLPEELPAGKEWSTRGIKAFTAGERPDTADVFERVRSVIDTFIDFDHSLADQNTMTEFIACYVLHTWFLDAFNVTGFLWPNGERGSGKTQLLFVTTEMAYLGIVVLSGGSFASLRDLADYGATIAFDDAEGLADGKKTDPDKRTLLLAGNRRGATVPLKEPRPDGTWKTRYVNAYCPRLFSAIRLPDPVLSSRTIIVPLIRTLDSKRGNADPLDFKKWPYERRKLLDDLWALALANLSIMPEFEKVTTEESSLVGRNLDPWRAILAVAGWLDTVGGVDGLLDRMKALSLAYQQERPELEVSDITGLTIRALCACVVRDMKDINPIRDINSGTPHFFDLSTSSITEKAKELAETEELDFNLEYITSRRIGRVLGKMRFVKSRKPGTRTRQWKVEIKDLERWIKSYGLDMPEEIVVQGCLPINVLDGINGLNGQEMPAGEQVTEEVYTEELEIDQNFMNETDLFHLDWPEVPDA